MGVVMTDKARGQLLSMKESQRNPNKMFRIAIKAFGWGGPVLDIVQDERRDDDYYEEQEGIPFVVEQHIYNQYKNFKIDYVSNWLAKGFVVRLAGGLVRGSC